MTLILIRADASLSIGSGHVMRCRTLARELERRGAAITFLCRRQRGDLISLLEQEFPVLALPELSLVAHQGLHGRELYGAWLGCSQEQDAADCLRVLWEAGIRSASWLVTDHYGLDAQWQAQLLNSLAQPKLLVIDDLADRPHLADLLLNQNVFGNEGGDGYRSLVPTTCRLLLGPHYALLGPEYAQLHPLVPSRSELRRVLVFLGGVDPDNLTGRVLEALQAPELAHLAVDVVLGLQSPHRQAVAELAARRNNTTLHRPLHSLAGLIARADVAIGAGGATTWERACLGLPSMVITIADNQLPLALALDEASKVQLLGRAVTVSADKIRLALMAALQQRWPRPSGHSLTDAWGTGRVATALMGLQQPLRLRPAKLSDEALLLRWANDSQVRANSYSPEPIAPGVHHRWFQTGLTDANRLLLIASDTSGCPLGQIRFDLQHPVSNHRPREALIDLSLDRCARGHGLATDLIHMGLQKMQQAWGSETAAVAMVLAENLASQATFSKAGFHVETHNNMPAQSSTTTRWCWRSAAQKGT
jgi:UDP-2,4-diacetamido-2,4,6-trideoxy-beta-L-altropyranose hydrolase